MRLGIRRKLIGTLILVGMFPLAMSLIVILGGGAVMQLSRIRGNYEHIASVSANNIAGTLLREELKNLILTVCAPTLIQYVKEQNRIRAAAGPTPVFPGTKIPAPIPADDELNKQWPSLTPESPILRDILRNPVADQLRRSHSLDLNQRQIFVTNAYGELIAAEEKPGDYFQADEEWWKITFDNGAGRVYLSSIIRHAGSDAAQIDLAIPIYDPEKPDHPVIGIIKDKLNASWVLTSLHDLTVDIAASAQLIDMGSDATVYQPAEAQHVEPARQFYLKHLADPHVRISTLLFNGIIIGACAVPLTMENPELYPGGGRIWAPHWVVVIAKPSEEAMMPVYKAATIVAVVGIVLILVLFILGLAISNREIIMPILRLREATAAVGRGELNVRLLADAADTTFRKDELGDLAHDFDEMTRELQKNVNQLARSNEAKRRFMELAGHELRTPVTYLIGVCQLAQRQLQQLAAAEGTPADERAVALAGKNTAATQLALAKIAAKTQRLSRIIDNLLKLVTNDQFTTRMNKTPVDVRALLLQVTSDHRPFIAERKQQLVLDIAENLPSIEADKDKLEDALTNLISNAIRFSPDGSTIRVAAHEVIGDMLEILVEDSGPGIPPQDLANLFEPFYTGEDILHHHSGTFEFGSKGIGLGLAIVRRFIELHGGIVRAHTLIKDPKAGPAVAGGPTGTQFQILLPLNREPEFGGAAPGTSAPPENAA